VVGLFGMARFARSHAMERPVSTNAGLGSIRLITANGEVVPLAFTPPQAMGKTFTIPLPRLEADRYKIEWQVNAEDGHVMAAGLNFLISGAPCMLTSAPLPKPKQS